MTRDEDWALPLKFRLEVFKFGTNETWNRRYLNIEQAFLHIFNDFNEDAGETSIMPLPCATVHFLKIPFGKIGILAPDLDVGAND